MRLAADGVGFEIGEQALLADITVEVPDGAMVALVGPNGSGKSTLLRLLYRALDPQQGTAWIDGQQLWQMHRRDAARLVGAVPQEQPTEFELTVVELVGLGRLPHQRRLATDGESDRAAVADAIAATGLDGLESRRLDELSGGERQRAVIARALAQEPAVLVLDEPTNHLDVRYQHDVLALLKDLQLTTFVALHDLNLAAAFCEHVVVLRDGRVLASGPVGEVLVPRIIEASFEVGVDLVTHPVTGRTQLLFHH